MADVELVIRIPEGLKKDFELEQWTALSCMEMKNALEKAKVNGSKAGKYEEGYEKYEHINSMDDCVDAVQYADTIVEADKEIAKEEDKETDDLER